MRRRLLLALLPLLFVLLVALEVPLAQTYAARLTQDLFIESIGDARRFAARGDEAMQALAGRRQLAEELRTQRRIRGRTITIVDRDSALVVPEATPAIEPATARALALALAGDEPSRPPTAWPWRTEPMIVAIGIGQDTGLTGAVAVEVSTGEVRDAVAERFALLAALGLSVVLLATVIGVLPLVRWVLRPVDALAATAARLAAGDLDARTSERGGPPELRGLAAAFNRMAVSLAAALERQRAFVADASHELRNPLAALRLRLDALAGSVHGEDARRLELAIAESERLARTVTRLLELARAEATAAERIDVDLAELTATRLEGWIPALEQVGCAVALESPEHAWARASPDAVEYALDVVLDNVCSYAARTRVEITIVHGAAGAELRVRDHGAGEDVGHIGERFWRGASHRAIPGTGLGIATARALLASSGGTLRVEPADPGLVATIGLPAAAATARTSAPRPRAAAPDRSQEQHDR
jgi:signal transduction histidine kinase